MFLQVPDLLSTEELCKTDAAFVSMEKRELLLELDTAARVVREKARGSEEVLLLMKTHGNLVRMWCEI